MPGGVSCEEAHPKFAEPRGYGAIAPRAHEVISLTLLYWGYLRFMTKHLINGLIGFLTFAILSSNASYLGSAKASSTVIPAFVQTSPAAGSPAPSPLADACVAPARAVLQDQDSSDHQVPWKRNGADKVIITFETKNMPADWVAELEKGVAAWNRSACLDTKLVETCQPNTNCVTVTVGDGAGSDGNFDAVESGGFTTAGHIDLLSTLAGGERTNVTIHEMGHAVGLAHRLTERVLMNGDTYDDVFDPDEIDFQNLLVSYGGELQQQKKKSWINWLRNLWN